MASLQTPMKHVTLRLNLAQAARNKQMTPEEMEQAIIRNLREKTGKSLEEWCALLKDSGFTEKRELKDLLKHTHGVGHFQTQTIVKCYLQT